MPLKPAFDFGMFMGSVVVHHHMQLYFVGKGRKGFSKRELAQIAKLLKKSARLPKFPADPVIVNKTIIVKSPPKKR
jgi:hypothetical protein